MLCLHVISETAALFPIGQVESWRADDWVHHVFTTGDMVKASWLNASVKV